MCFYGSSVSPTIFFQHLPNAKFSAASSKDICHEINSKHPFQIFFLCMQLVSRQRNLSKRKWETKQTKKASRCLRISSDCKRQDRTKTNYVVFFFRKRLSRDTYWCQNGPCSHGQWALLLVFTKTAYEDPRGNVTWSVRMAFHPLAVLTVFKESHTSS